MICLNAIMKTKCSPKIRLSIYLSFVDNSKINKTALIHRDIQCHNKMAVVTYRFLTCSQTGVLGSCMPVLHAES